MNKHTYTGTISQTLQYKLGKGLCTFKFFQVMLEALNEEGPSGNQGLIDDRGK